MDDTTMDGVAGSIPEREWLPSVWPFVREHLPAAPSPVLEIGCGPSGGFVPALEGAGYLAVGVDPEAPEGSAYRRTEFERYEVAEPVDAIIACTSLHHVAELEGVVNKICAALATSGVLIVVEWAWERFDEDTANWCFDRLPGTGGEHDWLRHHRDEWRASRAPWGSYLHRWARDHRLHSGQDVILGLENRFDTQLLTTGTYVFPELAGTTALDEQAAIDAGQIQATGIRYVGSLRSA
ncbi:MAG: methyltransferase domain-containing protein [Nocardioidaceae bacterium]|nr:methyltransferase domain-containing protein [Nocardioidaceae bacterium]